MHPQKVTSISTGRVTAASLFGQELPSISITGYEIHIGETTYLADAEPFAEITRGTVCGGHRDGCIARDGRIFGTYLHGLFDQDAFRHTFISAAREFYQLVPAADFNAWQAMRETSLNRLASEVEHALDMKKIFAWVDRDYAGPAFETGSHPDPRIAK
jgi:adenosylcobyric acid synthase